MLMPAATLGCRGPRRPDAAAASSGGRWRRQPSGPRLTFMSSITGGRWAPSAASFARRHWALLTVLALAALLRVATGIAYRPALLFPDSWAYLGAAYSGSPVGILPDKPAGLPVDPGPARCAGPQPRHYLQRPARRGTCGRATRVLATRAPWYGPPAGRDRHGHRRAGPYPIALEQHVLAESFSVLAVVASAWLITRTRDPLPVALACALLAGAVLIRVPAIFAGPVWLGYLVWSRAGSRTVAAGCLAMAVPLLAYAALHDARTGTFGFTQWEGWFLYGRTADLADCRRLEVPRRARNLCPTDADRRLEGRDPNAFIFWDARSPARQRFGEPDTRTEKLYANARLRGVRNRRRTLAPVRVHRACDERLRPLLRAGGNVRHPQLRRSDHPPGRATSQAGRHRASKALPGLHDEGSPARGCACDLPAADPYPAVADGCFRAGGPGRCAARSVADVARPPSAAERGLPARGRRPGHAAAGGDEPLRTALSDPVRSAPWYAAACSASRISPALCAAPNSPAAQGASETAGARRSAAPA